MTLEELQAALDRLDDGVLRCGSHQVGGREFCALEFESQVRGRAWSDVPITLPDLRPLNDAPWSSNEARTKALLPVMVAYWDWAEWTPQRRQAVMARLAILTVQRIVAELPGLPEDIQQRCRAAATLADAELAGAAAAEAAEAAAAAARAAARAAEAAAWAAAEAAAWAAAEAARAAARAAAEAARAAAADRVLNVACACWIEAAHEGAS